MKANQTISRNVEASDPYGFARLRKEGIEISQDLSGMEWTDYNFHDPGITILEQVCFGLTDLIYRTKFDVADYLCDESGTINTASLGLHLPQDVFFSRPSTPLDYQKALLDMSRDISDVQIFNGTVGSHSGGYGVYKIRVRKNPVQQGVSLNTEALIEQTRSNFHAIRNLCEDLGEIEVVEEIDCYLEAEVSIKPGYRVASVLAEVFYLASRELTKGISYKAFSEQLKLGEPLDEIFQGPLTDHGLIDDRQVVHTDNIKNKQLLESAILSASKEIEGIEYVASLRLRPVEQNTDQENIPVTCKYRLIEPNRPGDFKAVLVKSSGRQVSFAMDEFRAQLEILKFANNSKSYRLADDLVLSRPHEGTYRNLAVYQSVQNQFPDTYGINRYGVPESYSPERKAQALQLKSYLILFEQIMSNYLANLGSIKQLFSVRGNDKSTYYSGVLNNDEISSLERVYPSNAEAVLDDILGKIDDFVNRKSRLLDYLLALYGEAFSQDQLRNFNYYHSDAELERSIIFNKVRLLNRIKYASGDRGGAINLYAPQIACTDPAQQEPGKVKRLENVSGLQYRVSIFLGFRNLTPRSLVAEVFRHELTLLSHEQYLRESDSTSSSSTRVEGEFERLARELFRGSGDQTDKDERYYRFVRENYLAFGPFQKGQLSELILRRGVFNDNYRYDEKADELSLDLGHLDAAEDASESQISLLTGNGSQRTTQQQRFIRRLLIHINTECEGVHVLEHILLRPGNFMDQSHEFKDKYANKVSVIFPAWTARCNDLQFRVFAEDLVRDNCPAHIHPQIVWLDFASMCEFEVLHESWSELFHAKGRSEQSDELDVMSRSLIRFFELQKSRGGLFIGHQGGFLQLKKDIETELSDYVNRLAMRRKELELCVRRMSDEEQKYLQGIELLQSELKKFKVCTIEHMQLMPKDCELREADWEFYVSNVSVILPKLFSFRIKNEQNSHFHEIKTIVEDSIRAFINPGLTVNFHWIVPSDMRQFHGLHGQWLRFKSPAGSDNDDWHTAAPKLKHALKKLMTASESTGDIRAWVSVLGEP